MSTSSSAASDWGSCGWCSFCGCSCWRAGSGAGLLNAVLRRVRRFFMLTGLVPDLVPGLVPGLGAAGSALPLGDGTACRRRLTQPCSSSTAMRSYSVAREMPSWRAVARSEEHTSELQSHLNLVCRLLLEKKKNQQCVISCVL